MADELKFGKAFIDLFPRVSPAGTAAAEAQVGGMFASLKAKSALAGASMGTLLGGAVVAGAAAGLFKLGASFQGAFKTIRVETGQTGDALKGLEDSFKKVLSVRPDSMNDVALSIAKLNQGLGLTGKPLEELSAQVLRLSGITKTDLGTNLTSVTTLMNSWGISAENQGAKLDELFRASQATGVSVADLAGTMASAGPVLKTAGLSFEQSAALLGLLGKSGISTSAIMAPLSKAIATAAKEGKTAGDVFKDTFDAIRNAPDATSAAGAAIEVFGARAGPRLAGLIREGKLSYDELAATIASGTDTIAKAGSETSTLAGKFGILRNKVLVAIEPLATGFYNAINNLAGKALPIIGTAIEKVAGIIQEFVGVISTVIGAFQVLAGDDGAQGFGEIMDNLLGNSGKYVGFFRDLGERIRDIVTAAREFASAIGDVLEPILKRIGSFLGDNLQPILIAFGAVLGGGGLVAILGLLAGAITSIIGLFVGLVGALLSPIVVIAALVAAVVVAYQNWETFRNIVDTVVQFFLNTVVPAVTTFAQAVADIIGQLVAWVQAHWDQISEATSHIWNVISTIVQVAIEVVRVYIETGVAVIQAIWSAFGDTIISILQNAWNIIAQVVETAINLVKSTIELVLAIINGDWGAAWDAIKNILSTTWDLITTIVSSALDVLKTFIGDGLGAARDIVETILGEIVDFFTALPGNLIDAVGDLFGFLGDMAESAVRIALEALDKLLGPLDEAVGKFLDLVGGAKDFLFGGNLGADLKKQAEAKATPPKTTTPKKTTSSGWGRKRFAMGTDNAPDGLAIVGEQGPELVDLKAGSRVIPYNKLKSGDWGNRSGGPAVQIDEANFYDETDLDLLIGRASFAASSGRFG